MENATIKNVGMSASEKVAAGSLLTLTETAAWLSVAPATVYRLPLPSIRLGKSLRFDGVKDEPALAGAVKVADAREFGGPFSAGNLYRVNEKRPELLNVGNKQYLMMGTQGAASMLIRKAQTALAASRSISDAARRKG